jgi:hypothetical protein
MNTSGDSDPKTKYKKKAYIMHVVVHIIFSLSLAVSLLALLTLNVPMIIGLCAICLLQLAVTRNQTFIDWINKHCNMKHVYDSFEIINDW